MPTTFADAQHTLSYARSRHVGFRKRMLHHVYTRNSISKPEETETETKTTMAQLRSQLCMCLWFLFGKTTEFHSQPNCDHLRYSAIAWQHRNVWFEAFFFLRWNSSQILQRLITLRFEFGSVFVLVWFSVLSKFFPSIMACCVSNGHFTLFFILILCFFSSFDQKKETTNKHQKTLLSVLYGKRCGRQQE